MLSVLMNLLKVCWRPSSDQSDAVGQQDGLLWYKDTGQHLNGEFSMAVVQANNLLEDQSQLESGPLSSLESGPYGTFVGIYDGHGGPETSRYINDHLFHHLKICCCAGFTSEQQLMSTDVIRKAYQATEEGFLSLVTKQWPTNPQIAAVGSCCLVGVICGGILYIANLGDSRAVLGRLVKATGEVLAVQLSSEHNASIESVRQELYSLHPDDSRIVVLKHNVWRVKGLIQGIARRIVKAALQEAAKKREMRYSDLKKIDRGVRRHFHDDITVIIVFLDSNLVLKASSSKGPTVSVRGGGVNLPANSLARCVTPTELSTTL
ncbi:probable protein phosphatase 2C 46 isoform X3 [Magnolia sinica]|uniref:probable protein phosphatase 2C 46 isoform X3 n=1 Tax=Magnolia sinica TaxID=86752 RepID=UPI0026591D67|nr:probable protein phosphatase 2C 46 isoform X3 [Magnolia sinica]